jgi:hypothetical protein
VKADRSAATTVLDPKVLEERLWEIDKVAAESGTYDLAFAEVKRLAFRLRIDIANAASRV